MADATLLPIGVGERHAWPPAARLA
jgi:hypothetical protein